MMKKYAMGIDIGGTNTAFGLVDEDGNVVAEGKISTEKFRFFDDSKPYSDPLASAMKELIASQPECDLIGIGIGAPNANIHSGRIETPANLWKFEDKFKIYKEKTQGKKRILGLYLYNFGDYKKADPKQVAWQLDRYYELLRNKEVDGICLHTNTMADLDHEGYKVCCEWLEKHKDDVLPD